MNRRNFVRRVLGGLAAAAVPFVPRLNGQEQSDQCACCRQSVEPSFCEVTFTDFSGESQCALMIWDAQQKVWRIIPDRIPLVAPQRTQRMRRKEKDEPS